MERPLSSYLSLVTSEYQNSKNFITWLSVALQVINGGKSAANIINTAYDLDHAEGLQLDILGNLIGQLRTVSFQPSGGVSPTLDDDTYRILLKARIAQNNWDGKIDSLAGIWEDLFPGGSITVTDNQDMTMSVTLIGVFTPIISDLILNGYIVPRPQGVLCNYFMGVMPFFGYDLQDDYIAGYDSGNWVN